MILELVSNLEFKLKLAMKTTWATNEYPHLSCSSQGHLECFHAYVMSIIPLANISLVAYNGATTMEAILNYLKIEISWRGNLYSSLQ